MESISSGFLEAFRLLVTLDPEVLEISSRTLQVSGIATFAPFLKPAGLNPSEETAPLAAGTRKARGDGGGFSRPKKLTENIIRYAASTCLLLIG
jgi:hypothetical protein